MFNPLPPVELFNRSLDTVAPANCIWGPKTLVHPPVLSNAKNPTHCTVLEPWNALSARKTYSKGFRAG